MPDARDMGGGGGGVVDVYDGDVDSWKPLLDQRGGRLLLLLSLSKFEEVLMHILVLALPLCLLLLDLLLLLLDVRRSFDWGLLSGRDCGGSGKALSHRSPSSHGSRGHRLSHETWGGLHRMRRQ